MPNEKESSTGQDLMLLWRIVRKRMAILVTIITAIVTLSGAFFGVYNHFAKEHELIRNNCIRQAIDLDTKTDMQAAHHETIISIGETILQMFDNIGMSDDRKAVWTQEWNRVIIENTKSLNFILKQERNYNPQVIDACTKSETHIIQLKNKGSLFDMDSLLKSLKDEDK